MEVTTRMLQFKPLRSLLALACGLTFAACQPGGTDSAATESRFEVHPIYATGDGPSVVRFDTATGALQSASLVGGRNWKPIGDAVVEAGRAGRFGFNFAQAKSVALTFIRVDTETGEVWRMAYPRERDWIAFRETGEQAAAPAPTRKPGPPQLRKAVPATNEAAKPAPKEPVARRLRPGASPDDIDAYVEGFESENLPPEMRAWAAEQLGNVVSPEAVPPLVSALDSDDLSVVRAAIRALGKHDDPRVRPALEKMAAHESPEIARVAKGTLAKLK
jgi:hypothetical protein